MKKEQLEKEIKQMLVDVRNGALITPILRQLVAIAHCGKCYGKGYGTQTLFAGSSRSKIRIEEMVFCDCPRGKELMKLWHDGEEKIIKRLSPTTNKER